MSLCELIYYLIGPVLSSKAMHLPRRDDNSLRQNKLATFINKQKQKKSLTFLSVFISLIVCYDVSIWHLIPLTKSAMKQLMAWRSFLVSPYRYPLHNYMNPFMQRVLMDVTRRLPGHLRWTPGLPRSTLLVMRTVYPKQSNLSHRPQCSTWAIKTQTSATVGRRTHELMTSTKQGLFLCTDTRYRLSPFPR